MNRLFSFHSYDIYFVIIICLGIFLRIFLLSSVPSSASLDEVSIGYNAYSILKTGKDEYGTRFPLLLRAYDDWRPALYVYFTIPFIWVFGLGVFAVRFPSFILSTISIVSVFFLVKKIVKNMQDKYAVYIPYLSSLFLSISPWHIYLSRLGHEVNAGISFLIFGLTFLVYENITWAVFFFALSFMSYQSEKIIIPLLVFPILFTMKKLFFSNIRKTAMAFIISLILIIPFLNETLKPNALIRFQATSVFHSYPHIFEKAKEKYIQASKSGNLLEKYANTTPVVGLKIILKQYLSHFSPQWLIANSGSEDHKVPHLGVLYLWEFLLAVIGLYIFIRSTVKRKYKIILLFLFFVSPIPSAITTQAPHAMRSFTIVFIWHIFAAFGVYELLKRSQNYYSLLIAGGVIVLLYSLILFVRNYFYTFPIEQSDSFQYALHKTIPYLWEKRNQYDKVVISNQGALYQSYMFFLFDTHFNPNLYHELGGTGSGGYNETHKIGKFEFRSIDWKRDEKNKKILYVGNINDIDDISLCIKKFQNAKGDDRICIW